jgi:hypothetical protein
MFSNAYEVPSVANIYEKYRHSALSKRSERCSINDLAVIILFKE